MVEQLERVRAFNSEVTPPSPEVIAAARGELMRTVREESRSHRRSAGGRPGRHWARRVAVALVAVSLGAVIAGLLGSPSVTAPQPALATTLHRLARAAANQEWIGIPGPGQYLYTESEGPTEADTMGGETECRVQMVQHRQIWIATDGSGAIKETEENARFTSAADQQACAQLNVTDPGSQADSWSNSFSAGGLSFPTNDWQALSTDPATLLVQLRKLDGGPRTAGEDFVHIGDFLRESDAPPAIRSALYEAAALIPGVKLLGEQRDPTGRSGLAVGFPYANGNVRMELIFNRQTGALLAEETFEPEGKLADWTAYQPSEIRDNHPGYPATSEQPQGSSGSGSSQAGQ